VPSPDVSGILFPELLEFKKKNYKRFVFSHLNINSLRYKIGEIKEVLSNGYTDILCLSETKIDDSFPNAQFDVKGFTMHRMDRNEHGGGLLCYVNSNVPHRCRKDIAYNKDGIESIVVEVKFEHEKQMFIFMYKQPSVSKHCLVHALDLMYNKSICECKSVYVVGDLNVNLLKEGHDLADSLQLLGIKNVVKGPTCSKNVLSPSQIDVILTNTAFRIACTLNIDIGVSDCHNYISAATKVHAPIKVKHKVSYRSYKHFNESAYINDMSVAPLYVADIFDDVDDKLWCQQTLIKDILDVHAPLKTKIVKHKPVPYMNDKLRKAINVKGMLRRKYVKYKTRSLWLKYKEQRNVVNRLKRVSIQNYFDEKCNNSGLCKSGKIFWDTVKPYFSSKSGSSGQSISLLQDSKVVSEATQVSNIFNDYFVNIACDLSEPTETDCMSISQLIEHYDDHVSVQMIKGKHHNANTDFNFKPVTVDVVKKKIQALKCNKACGHDQLPARSLKCVSEELCSSYTSIINACIEKSVFPQSLKDADVSPIFKKGDILSKENYRPVSVLTATSKIYESILCDQLKNFFSDKLSPLLAGFRKNFSCENVLLMCVEKWKQALDRNECVGCIAMDLSRAFDSLPHGLLVAKLYAYGCSTNACKQIKHYLSHRRQRVKVQNVCGEWKEIERGVPQGSLAGPLLFNIFINDFIYFIKDTCDLFNYADDNTLSYSHNDPFKVKEVLEQGSNVSLHWFHENKMKANPSKFQAMVLNRKPVEISFQIGDDIIMPQECIKLLGVSIDSKLSFTEHISQLCKTAGKQINAMSRLSNVLSKDNKMLVLNSFIVSNFNYSPLVYHICGKGNSHKMEHVIERGLRIVCNDFESNISTLKAETQVKSLFKTRVKLLAEHVFKVVKGLAPQFPNEYYELKKVRYDLRKETSLVLPNYCTKTYGFNSLSYLGPKLWNMMPNVCNNMTLIEFKAFINQWDGPVCCGQCHLCFI